MNDKKLNIALLILRIGLGVVFLLFGYQKLSNPSQTTSEIQLVLAFIPLAGAAAINFYLGLTEVTVSIGLLTGIYARFFGIIAALLTTSFFASFLIKFGFSINPDLYRDIGLTAIGIALGILGAGNYKLKKKQATPL